MQEVFVNQLSSSTLDTNLKCQIHQQRYISIFLESTSNEQNPMKCTKCGTNERFDLSKTLGIEDILDCKSETILDNWPLFGLNHFDKIQQLPSLNYEGIRTFFKELRSTFAEQMDRIEEKIVSQYQIIDQNKKLMYSYYNRVSQKDNLVKVVQECLLDPEKSVQSLIKILSEVSNERKTIEKDMKHCHQVLAYYQDYLSIESLEKYAQSIKSVASSLEKVINFEIFNLYGNSDDKIIVLEQKEQFQNPVYPYTKHHTYSIPQITEANQCGYCRNCSCGNNPNKASIKVYHQDQHNSSFVKLKQIGLLIDK